MAERGTVVAVRAGVVDVRMSRTAACENCSACTNVQDGMMLRDVRDTLGASVGDEVDVGFTSGVRPVLMAAAWGTPIVGLVIGYISGFLVASAMNADADAVGALLALGGAVGGLVVARTVLRRLAAREAMQPVLRAIIARGLSEGQGEPPRGGSCDDVGGSSK